MRIAIIHWTNRSVGGAETHLADIVPELARAGHVVTFVIEQDGPSGSGVIAGLERVDTLSVAELGADGALAAIRRRRPDVVYSHGLLDVEFERRVLEVAPAALFMHNYYGTCISGAKSFKFPVGRPCERRFGAACLVNYYPRRCGGWNPVTMVSDYRRQRARLELLQRYRVIMTSSRHMRSELERHGVPPDRIHIVEDFGAGDGGDRAETSLDCAEWRLIFAGRMDATKGGKVAIEALRRVSRVTDRRLSMTFVGDGPDRKSWERRATSLARDTGVRVEFTGWVDPETLRSRLATSHLLIVPSCWPEPFGLVGLQAAAAGVPAAAFAVGGIPEWLIDGVNGHLAPADPPTAAALADAIRRCFSSPAHYAALRSGAAHAAAARSRARVLASVLEGLRLAAEAAPAPAGP